MREVRMSLGHVVMLLKTQIFCNLINRWCIPSNPTYRSIQSNPVRIQYYSSTSVSHVLGTPFYVKLYCQIASLKMTNIMPRVNNDCDDKRLEVSDVSTCYQRQSRNLPVSSLSTVSSLSSPLYSLHLCGHSYSLFFMLTIVILQQYSSILIHYSKQKLSYVEASVQSLR